MLLAVAVGSTHSCTCSPPILHAVAPDRAYPRQIIALDVEGTFTEILWDAGTDKEVGLTHSWLVTPYLQVPEDAEAGEHKVAVWNPGGRSAERTVTVLEASGTFPPPRIETVTIYSARVEEGELVLILMVAAANLDMQAELSVDGHDVPTVFFSALPVPYLLDHVPKTFGYPVYHYGQVAGVVKGASWGDGLKIVVTNTDGEEAELLWWLPLDAESLDSDGDGLTDAQETSTAGLNLPAFGVHRLRKDILVEVDWMDGATPDPAAWSNAEAVFADAPVLNPDGSAGINLVVDRGQGGPHTGGGDVLTAAAHIGFAEPEPDASDDYAYFYDFKDDAFAADRLKVFRYCVSAYGTASGLSGQGEVPGDDFFLALADSWRWGTPRYEAALFVHELGHTMGLRHGGHYEGQVDDDVLWENKPNHPSVMSYLYMWDGISVDGDLEPDEPPVYTYSEGQLKTLHETEIDEKTGILDDIPLDLNGDGDETDSGAMDLNGDSNQNESFRDYDQWGLARLFIPKDGSD